MQNQDYFSNKIIKIIHFPEDKLELAQIFFSSYGGEYQELVFQQGCLLVSFHESKYILIKEFNFQSKSCFQKVQENVYKYQKQHNTWSESQIQLQKLNKAIESTFNQAYGMGGRSLFFQCICGGISISFEVMSTNNGDFDCSKICQDCGRKTFQGPGTNGIQVIDQGK